MKNSIGFIGLGVMGRPMALHYQSVAGPLLVWTRSQQTRDEFAAGGSTVAATAAEVFETCDTIILMLGSADALDQVLGRGTDRFTRFCAGKTLIQMATTLPGYSKSLEADILAAGGRYAEVPVSGSSVPAASGKLILMHAGDPQTLADIAPIVAPFAEACVTCGAVPSALQLKLAVNICLTGVFTGLVEGMNFARQCGIDLTLFRNVLEAGQLSSPLLKMKMPKLVDEDYSAQASVEQAVNNLEMMKAAGKEAGAFMPIVATALERQQRMLELGHGDLDAVAAIMAYREMNGT